MVKKVSITVYLATQNITGNILLPDGKRLSDILNRLSPYPDSDDAFIELSDVTISHSNGQVEKSPVSYVNKEAIQLVTTLDTNLARGIGAQDGSKQYPYIQKKPKWTKMCMPSYEVTGNLHYSERQRVSSLLQTNQTFLPLTDVRLRTTEDNDYWKVAFAAVNRNQILCLRHEEN
ncbi:hypothetical protein ACFLS8_03185 [Chloroflexota bacterium]